MHALRVVVFLRGAIQVMMDFDLHNLLQSRHECLKLKRSGYA